MLSPDEQLELPLVASERLASRKQLDQIHPANRFWMMARLPLLEIASDRLAYPPSVAELMESRRQLDKLHPGNRFRLMFGLPLLPQEDYDNVVKARVNMSASSCGL